MFVSRDQQKYRAIEGNLTYRIIKVASFKLYRCHFNCCFIAHVLRVIKFCETVVPLSTQFFRFKFAYMQGKRILPISPAY